MHRVTKKTFEEATSVPIRPLRVSLADPYVERGADHATFPIDVSIENPFGSDKQHGAMIQVMGNPFLAKRIVDLLNKHDLYE